MYSVKQLARLAGISVRTLHYYDEIGLLRPSSVSANHYRSYNEQALLRLQQILFYREMGLDLFKIKNILEDKNFDLETALQSHRQALQAEIRRLEALINTVDTTLMHLKGEKNMSENELFAGFSLEKQKEYEEEATRRWGESVTQSNQLWNSYSSQKKAQILQEGREIYAGLAANMDKGPQSAEVQAWMARWHQNLRNFYEPTPEILLGLGDLYCNDPGFNDSIRAVHPDLPDFMQKAIGIYVKNLKNQAA